MAALVIVGVMVLRVAPPGPDRSSDASSSSQASTATPQAASPNPTIAEFCQGFADLALAQSAAVAEPDAGEAELLAAVEDFRALGRPAGMPSDARAGLDVTLEGLVDPEAPMEGADSADAAAFGTYLNAVCGVGR